MTWRRQARSRVRAYLDGSPRPRGSSLRGAIHLFHRGDPAFPPDSKDCLKGPVLAKVPRSVADMGFLSVIAARRPDVVSGRADATVSITPLAEAPSPRRAIPAMRGGCVAAPTPRAGQSEAGAQPASERLRCRSSRGGRPTRRLGRRAGAPARAGGLTCPRARRSRRRPGSRPAECRRDAVSRHPFSAPAPAAPPTPDGSRRRSRGRATRRR